ncbi:MAG: tetratricopeptide repeat protein, partial [Fimbriimonadales bacterium]
MRILSGIARLIVAFGLLRGTPAVHGSEPIQQKRPSAPAAREFESLMRELEQKFEQGQYADLLKQTQEAAQERRLPSVFLNHLRARALHRLRPQEPAQREELMQLWNSLRTTYREWGYAPGEVEATLALAFWHWQTDRTRAEQLLNEVWQRADADTSQPLAVAQALSSLADDWFEIKEWAVCQRLWERALALQEAHGAEELALARTRYNLGVVALRQNQLEQAQTRLQAAWATQQRLAPDSPALASTLLALGELAQRRDQLTEAQNHYQRAQAIHTAHALSTIETAQIHLGLADIARQQRRWEDAQAHYTQALQIAESEDPQSREAARARAGLGVVALEQGELTTAEEQLQRARQSPHLEPLEQAQIDHELGRVAWRRGNLDDAVALLTRALEHQQALQDTPLNRAKTLYNLGVLKLERGELAHARRAFTQAREIRERIAPRSLAVAHSLMGLGFVAYYEGDFAAARRLFEQSLDLYETLNADPADRSRALMGLGLVAVEQGELNLAQNFLENALRIQEENRLTNTTVHAQTRIGLGNLYLRRGSWDDAARHYRRAHDIARNAPSLLHAQALVGLGNLALRQRDLRQAEAHYKQALEILESRFPNSPVTIQALLNAGIVALESGDADVARSYFEDAERNLSPTHAAHLSVRVRLNSAILQIRRGDTARTLPLLDELIAQLQDAPANQLLLGQAYFYRGVLLARQGKEALAREDFNRALKLYQQVAPNTIFVALAQLSLAKQDYRAGDAPSARARLEDAVAIIERQRALILDPDLQAAFSENYFEAYSLLALLEAERGNNARAAELLEQSRARALLEQIQRTRLASLNASPEWQALQSQWQAREAERIETRRQLDALPPDDATRSALYDKLASLEQQLQQIESELRTRFPAEARLLTPPTMTLATIQQLLEPDVALIYHALVENNLLSIVVTKHSVQAHYQLVNVSALYEDVQEFLSLIQEGGDEAATSRVGARLYQTLIAPIAEFLSGYERILICSEGVLNQLPWAALTVESRAGKPVYWVERVAIHLVPSMGVYRYARLQTPTPRGVLVAAVSKYQADLAQTAPDAGDRLPEPAPEQVRVAVQRGAALNDLPAAGKEAEGIAALSPEVRVLREDAVHPEVVREQARIVRVLHFACHADAKSENPLESALKFDAQGQRWLTAAQIMAHWRLQADLVMLSACETASGKVYRYEGVY